MRQVQKRWLTPDRAREAMSRLPDQISRDRDARARIKAARALAFAAASVIFGQAAPSRADLVLALASMTLARRHGARIEDQNRAAAAMMRAISDLDGSGEPSVRAQRRKTVAVEAAMLAAACSPHLACDWSDPSAGLAAMNGGEAFLVSTGADGRHSLAVRLIDGPEPRLLAEEFGQLEDCSDVGHLRCQSGELYFGAAERPGDGARIDAPCGLLRVQAFRLRRRYLLVACPADQPPAPLVAMPEVPAL